MNFIVSDSVIVHTVLVARVWLGRTRPTTSLTAGNSPDLKQRRFCATLMSLSTSLQLAKLIELAKCKPYINLKSLRISYFTIVLDIAVVFDRKHIVSLWIELYNVIQTRCTATEVDDNLVAINLKRKALPDQMVTYTPEELQARRNQKADTVKSLAIVFRDELLQLVQEYSTYYLHGLVHHLPDQIRECPVDVMDGSGSGIEQINQYTKRNIQYVIAIQFN